jgi:hypothetical protein
MKLWTHTIRGFEFVFGEAYVLLGTATRVLVMPNCGQETRYECFRGFLKKGLFLRTCGGTEIRSAAHLLSPFDLNTIPPLEQDEMTVFLIQFRPYLAVN